jgi:primosomal protein N''
VLEHFDNIYEIKNLKTKYVLISVPECHHPSDKWFEEWKHRRPDEHLWHFDKNALQNFFAEIGYEMVAISNIEDAIRKPVTSLSNILTCLFRKI